MNEQHTTTGSEVAPTSDHGSTAVRLDQGHHVGDGGLPARFENPGLPLHVPRAADLSEEGARRAEKQVAALFLLSIVATLPLLLGWLVLGPVLAASLYTAYKDIYFKPRP